MSPCRRGFWAVVVGCIGVSAAALVRAGEAPGSVGRMLTAAELRGFLGADGGSGSKDCVPSPANCSNIVPCPPQGAYDCTTCVPGPGSNICRNAETQGCEATVIHNCPTALAGSCFMGTCVTTSTVVQCGVYFTCQ